MRRLTLATALLLALLAPSAHASSSQLLIFQDDGRMRAAPEATAQEIRELGADVVKIQLSWGDVAPAGRHKPAGFDGGDPAGYDWDLYQREVQAIAGAGMRPYISLGAHAPRWATNGRGRPGTGRPNAKEFELFAEAAGRMFPGCHIWSIWNEPNLYSWRSP